MNKIEYAKFQFMILVLRALYAILIANYRSSNVDEHSRWQVANDISTHIQHLESLMEEK